MEPDDQPPVIAQIVSEPVPATERTPLNGLPLPPAVIVLAVVTAIAFVVGLTRLPHSLSAGINYEHAKADLANGKPEEAVKLMAPLLAQYPEATELKIDLAKAYLGAGDVGNAAKLIEDFDGKKVSNEEGEQLNQLEAEISAKLEPLIELQEKQSGHKKPKKGSHPSPLNSSLPNSEDQ